ncbi:ribosomal protein S5 domain 2-type protein [Aspergillus unguis]
MAWKSPNCVVQTMQSVRSTNCLRATLSQRSSAPSYFAPKTALSLRTQWRQSTRGYATGAQAEAAQPNAAHPVAPEIDFTGQVYLPKGSRIVPASPAYFSGNPRFIDQLLKLESLVTKYKSLSTVPANEAPRQPWLKLPAFRELVGETVPIKKYKSIIKLLQRLNRIDPKYIPEEARSAIKEYLRPGDPYGVKQTTATPDELGRVRAKGKRKASSAVVYLVEGDGQVLVNGKSMLEVFPRLHDRESVTWALSSVSRLDKYNVWANVRGGGTTGQAEAIGLALGRALMIHEPALKPVLRRAGVITVDARRVERKKPGRVKARKAPTWVKR